MTLCFFSATHCIPSVNPSSCHEQPPLMAYGRNNSIPSYASWRGSCGSSGLVIGSVAAKWYGSVVTTVFLSLARVMRDELRPALPTQPPGHLLQQCAVRHGQRGRLQAVAGQRRGDRPRPHTEVEAQAQPERVVGQGLEILVERIEGKSRS